MKHLTTILTLLAIAACSDPCEPYDERCADNILEICGDDGEWYEIENCAVSSPDWVCCEHDDALWCLPEPKCDEVI